MIKAWKKLEIKGTFLNIIKAIHDKPTAKIILNGEQLKPVPLRSGMGQGCQAFHTPTQFGIPSHSNKIEQEIKEMGGTQDGD
jgi:hypothetical protein